MSQAIDYVARLAQTIGARPGGTEEEQQASFFLEEVFQNEAELQPAIEEFNCNPNIHLPRVIYSAAVALLAILAIILPLMVLPSFIATVVLTVLFVLDMLSIFSISQFTQRGISQNVIAKYVPPAGASGEGAAEPAGRRGQSRKRKVIILARYDSGKVDKLANSPLFKVLPFLPWVEMGGMVAIAVALLLRVITGATGVGEFLLSLITGIGAVCALLPLVQFALSQSSPYNEGANCNASGVAVLLEVAKRVQRTANDPEYAAQLAEVRMHGEEVIRDAGLVPEGAKLEYDAGEAAPAQSDVATLPGNTGPMKKVEIVETILPGQDLYDSVDLGLKRQAESRSAGAEGAQAAAEAADAAVAAAANPASAAAPGAGVNAIFGVENSVAAANAASSIGVASGMQDAETISVAKSEDIAMYEAANAAATQSAQPQPASEAATVVTEVAVDEQPNNPWLAMRAQQEAAQQASAFASPAPAQSEQGNPWIDMQASTQQRNAQSQKSSSNVPDWFKRGMENANANKSEEEEIAQDAPVQRSRFADALDNAHAATLAAAQEAAERETASRPSLSGQLAAMQASIMSSHASRMHFQSEGQAAAGTAADAAMPDPIPAAATAQGPLGQDLVSGNPAVDAMIDAQANAAEAKIAKEAMEMEQSGSLATNSQGIDGYLSSTTNSESFEASIAEESVGNGVRTEAQAQAMGTETVSSTPAQSKADAAAVADRTISFIPVAQDPAQMKILNDELKSIEEVAQAADEAASESLVQGSKAQAKPSSAATRDARKKRTISLPSLTGDMAAVSEMPIQDAPVVSDEERGTNKSRRELQEAISTNLPSPDKPYVTRRKKANMKVADFMSDITADADEVEGHPIDSMYSVASAAEVLDEAAQSAANSEKLKKARYANRAQRPLRDADAGEGEAQPRRSAFDGASKRSDASQSAANEASEPSRGNRRRGAVSEIGSFGVASSTSSFKPVGDELVENVNSADLYIHDADDSDYAESFTHTGAPAGAGYVDMPKSRASRLFGHFRKRKSAEEERTLAEEIGVDENFDARRVGAERGSWESFKADSTSSAFEDDWEGGAFSKMRAAASNAAGKVSGLAKRGSANDDEEMGEEDGGTRHSRSFGRSERGKRDSGRSSSAGSDRSSRGTRRSSRGSSFQDIDVEEISSRRNSRIGAEAIESAHEEAVAKMQMIEDSQTIPVDGRELRGRAGAGTSGYRSPYDDLPLGTPLPEERDAMYEMASSAISTEVWFVALGAELVGNAGIKAFLQTHSNELSGAMVIDLDAMGAGDVATITDEGTCKRMKASSRMKRFAVKAGQVLGLRIGNAKMNWRESASYFTMKRGLQTIHLAGMKDDRPAYWGSKNDVIENVSSAKLSENATLVMELLRTI